VSEQSEVKPNLVDKTCELTTTTLEALLLLRCHREHYPTNDDELSTFAKKAINFVLTPKLLEW